jgi:hypothetical protein
MAAFTFAKRDSGSGVAPTAVIRVNDNQTLVKGHLLIISSSKASKSGAAPTADTVLGVAEESITTTTATNADQIRYIPAHADVVYRVQYLTSGTKTSFTDADLGTAYDINATSHKLDPDDTLGGFLELVGYNNTDNVAFVRILPAKLYFS